MSALPKHLLTAEDFAALPREGLRLELVRGEIVAMPPAFEDHGEVAMLIGILIGHHVLTHNLGKMYAAETGFLIARSPDTVRAPDVAFIQASRLLAASPSPGWATVIPDFVAEVVSSGDRPAEIADKVRMWLDAGVRLVWVAFPERKTMEVHRPGEPLATLTSQRGDILDGYDVIPGLSLSVTSIFP